MSRSLSSKNPKQEATDGEGKFHSLLLVCFLNNSSKRSHPSMASLGAPPHRPLCAVLMSALILGLLFMAVYSLSHREITYDPLYAGESLGDGGKQGCLGKSLHSRLGANQDSPSVFEGFPFNYRTQRAWNTVRLENLTRPPLSELELKREPIMSQLVPSD